MKTAVTVLQEMMVKWGEVPEYECISQTGPQHQAMFEIRCAARGLAVTGAARSKKEAKQDAARRMLAALAARGEPVPAPYAAPPAPAANDAGGPGGMAGGGLGAGARSYVALLKELCEEYRLPGCEYTLRGDAGPAHCRLFTVHARIAQHERQASGNTKKAAKQLAAYQLYTYFRDNLARLTTDFVEEEALMRAHERAMERYEAAREDAPWRPDLGQRVADYHLGLVTHIEQEKCVPALEKVEAWYSSGAHEETAEEVVTEAAAALGLNVTWRTLGEVNVVELGPAAPPVALAGAARACAAARALQYLRLTLAQTPPEKPDDAAD